MAAIRASNTKPELALRAALREAGATGYRIHMKALPGKPDIVFTRWRVAIFVDGAFWHGHPEHFHPERASDYWREKIARNQARDRAADQALSQDGWQVHRFWDFEIKASLDVCVETVLSGLRRSGWPGECPAEGRTGRSQGIGCQDLGPADTRSGLGSSRAVI
jgi:DNA mismatch endonuclease, patch repair protein